MKGTSGKAKNRLPPVTAIAHSLLSLTNSSSAVATEHEIDTLAEEIDDGAPPRYGTCWSWMPAFWANSSIVKA